jgi:hypothetical protein
MPAFASLLGKRVEASYRAGDVHMTVTGTLALDSGQRIHLEERFSQGGRNKTLRIEIPYASIVRVREVAVRMETSPAS